MRTIRMSTAPVAAIRPSATAITWTIFTMAIFTTRMKITWTSMSSKSQTRTRSAVRPFPTTASVTSPAMSMAPDAGTRLSLMETMSAIW